MADAAAPSAGGDQGPREERVSISQPAGDVEMDDLSKVEPQPTNPETKLETTTSPSQDPDSDSAPTPTPAPILASAPIPVPDKDLPASESASAKARGKAPAQGDDQDLTIDPAEPPAGDLAVDIMLLLTSGARHPFRIDEKYLTKRNVTVTGKTEDGRMDPFSITVYTLKELILRDWRREWDQPPREPSAIRLIHFGKLLEDRNQLSRKLLFFGARVARTTV